MDDILSVICHWVTYKGTHCNRTVERNEKKFKLCKLHNELSREYLPVIIGLCEVSETIKIVPRSYKHLKSVMKQMQYDQDEIEIQMKNTTGELKEEAIILENCIKILSDDMEYYFNARKDQKSAKNLKVVLKKFCPNTTSIIKTREKEYCEECYMKLQNVPKISVIKNFNLCEKNI